MKDMIYFDNSATTRISDAALETYLEVSRTDFGNPSSLHSLGLHAEHRMEQARAILRRALGTEDGAVVFTAGGSEANNLAILGRAHAKERYRRGAKILTTAGEHASVTAPLDRLAAEGYTIVQIPTKNGVLDMEALQAELSPNVILLTMMMVNNETGAWYDLAAVSRIMRERCPDAILHVDATQSFLKVPFTARKIGADMITVSSHKIEGPKGVGALWIGRELLTQKGIAPMILGGGQEGGLRSGTENVPGIAAFGTAAQNAMETLDARHAYMEALRARLLDKLGEARFADVHPTLPVRHAPHILNITLPDIKSETLLHFLSAEGICVSSGSACSSHGAHASPALIAFGRSQREADCSIRISFSHHNTNEEIDRFCDVLEQAILRLSRMRRR